MERYWKYFLILIPAIVLLALELLKKKPASGSTGQPGQMDPTGFDRKVQEIKEDLQEVNTIAEAKTALIKKQEQAKLAELETISHYPNKAIRRKQLAEFLNNMRG